MCCQVARSPGTDCPRSSCDARVQKLGTRTCDPSCKAGLPGICGRAGRINGGSIGIWTARLEGEPAGEAAGTTASLATEGMTAGRGETTTTATVHHVEQDVGVDVDVCAVHAAHTAHSSHSMHTAHAAEAAAAKHVRWVDQVVAVIVSSTFPEEKDWVRKAAQNNDPQ